MTQPGAKWWRIYHLETQCQGGSERRNTTAPLFFSLLLKPHWDMPLSASVWGRKKDRWKRHMGIFQQKENHVLTLFQIGVLEFLILLFHLLLPWPKL